MAGALITALVEFAWLWTGFPLRGLLVVVPAASLVCTGLAALRARRHVGTEDAAPPPECTATRVVLVLLLAVTVQRVLIASTEGVTSGDELYLWSYKAKLIFEAGGFNDEFLRLATRPVAPLFHADYQLLNPLLQVWVFAHAGEITHFANRLPIQGFAVAWVLLVVAALRRWTGPAWTGLLALLLVALPTVSILARTAHADLMVGLGALMAADAWLRWRNGRRPWAWRLVCIGLAVMLWSKNEGMLYLCGFAAAFAVACPSPRRAWAALAGLGRELAWLGLPLAILVLHWGFNAHFGFQNDLVQGDAYGKPFWEIAYERAGENLGPVLAYFGREGLVGAELTNWLLLTFLACLVAAPRRAFGGARGPMALALLAVLVGFLLVYTGTPKGGDAALRLRLPPGAGVAWHLKTSAPRLLVQILPCVALWLALFLRPSARD